MTEIQRKKREEIFIQKLKKLRNDEFTLIGKYIKNNQKVKIKHNKCGYKWKVLPMQLTRNNKPTGCPKCKGTLKKDIASFINEVNNLHNHEYSVLSDEYIDNKTKVKVRHNICNFTYDVTPSDILSGYGCPNCFGTLKKTLKNFKEEVYEKYQNTFRILSDTYKGTNSDITVQHNCGFIFTTTPNRLLNGNKACDICLSQTKNKSRYNLKIMNYLKSINVDFDVEKTFDDLVYKRNLYFDFYIREENLVIEFDGDFHFKEIFDDNGNNLKIQKTRDNIKNKYCINNELDLIRIDIFNKENLDEILKGLFLNEERSTTIKRYNLFSIKDGNIFNDNGLYLVE